MFQLTEMTEAMLASVTNRTETHGDERKPAVSLGFELTLPNTILDSIDPTLREALYKAKPDAEPELPEISDAEGLDMHGVEEQAEPAQTLRTMPATRPRNAAAYRNAETGETWSGRGLKPRWLTHALEAGRSLSEFEIAPESDGVAASRRRMRSAAPAHGTIE